jgi:N6-adenosine-specific RNA methylase IME4
MTVEGFPIGEWDVALIDPPWQYYGAADKWGAAEKFYRTMSQDQIESLPVGSIVRGNGIVFLWATSPLLDVAISTLGKWGFAFRGVAFVWVKSRKDGTPIGAQGVRPSIVKPTAEYVIAGSRARRGRPIPLSCESTRNVVLAPRREHSRKPDEIHGSIESMYPNARKIELFARASRVGWDAWGDELGKFGNGE